MCGTALHNVAGNGPGAMLRFETVGMRFGAGPEVLRDVTFLLEAGSFTFLTGPSGAGKTTLLRLMYLAEPPSRGLITLFGCDLATTPRSKYPALRRRIGVVFQDFRLLDHLSAFDNVALPLRLAGKRVDNYAHDVEELLDWVGLGNKLEAKPPTLSGGEQQRIAIARAVVARPDLLLADEPTGNVDPDIAQRLVRLFEELNRLGTTVLIATHDRSLLEQTKAREMRLVDGRLVEMRTPRI
ncbi:MAG TPA: cell division ATP-binding protein FtsE [Rhizomicrobium sp.]|jgi:cell division transport system ATP-binding protein|nr:cell division ATP-binding protein FtsE [Rhizomicrobium sp.]